MKKNVKRINESQLRTIVAESVKRVLTEDNNRFATDIYDDIATLSKIYDKWQYATYKPQGMDDILDDIISIKIKLGALLPDREDFGPYEEEGY